jgi:predicted TIM-barrel fold metal-dependent hydrolase
MTISVERTREIMEPYFQSHDPAHIAADAVYTAMETGQEWKGREAIAESLNYIYAQAFESQMLSFVAEGVFAKYPDLKVVFIESGFMWVPAAMWRVSDGQTSPGICVCHGT